MTGGLLMPPPILRPGRASPNGVVDDTQPTLYQCRSCGHQMLVPMALAPVVDAQHQPFCIGPVVRRILALLEPPPVAEA